MLLVGLFTAVLAGYWAFQLSNAGARRTGDEVPRQNVVVAAREIAGRAVVQPEDLTVRSVPADSSLALAFADPAPVLGRVTGVALLPGQVVYPNMLVTTAAGAPFSIAGTEEVIEGDAPSWRAVSVMVPNERAVGGQIVAGQRVDLFATVTIEVQVLDAEGTYVQLPTTEGFVTGESTKVIIQDLEVLQSMPEENLYVLKTDLHQAEQISHIAKVAPGAFSLALRPDGDTRYVDQSGYGETNDSIILRYVFPVPMIMDLTELTGVPIAPLPPGPTPTPTEEAAAPTPTPEP